MKKKILSLILATLMCVSLITPAYAAIRSEDNWTMGELQTQLLTYFEENNIDLKVGTPEYLSFITNQLIYGTDKQLKEHPNYSLLHAYMAHYKNAAAKEAQQTYLQAEVSQLNTTAVSIPFHTKSDFLQTTIGGIKAEVVTRENTIAAQQAVRSESAASPRSVNYTYSVNDAVTYARTYALNYNTNYPNFYDNDCVNFVSQCLIAGGMTQNGSPSHSGQVHGVSTWYCQRINSGWGYTTSWISNDDFRTYWANRCDSWWAFADIPTLNSYARRGSIVQLREATTNEVYHAMFITYSYQMSVNFCAHTNDRYETALTGYLIDDSANNYYLYLF